MKRFFAITLALSLFLSLSACGSTAIEPQDQAAPEETEDAKEPADVSATSLEDVDTTLLESITVTYEMDETLNQALVTVTNTGASIFSGTINVSFQNAAGDSVGQGSIFIEDLTTGNDIDAKIDLSAMTNVEFSYHIRSYTFMDPGNTGD